MLPSHFVTPLPESRSRLRTQGPFRPPITHGLVLCLLSAGSPASAAKQAFSSYFLRHQVPGGRFYCVGRTPHAQHDLSRSRAGRPAVPGSRRGPVVGLEERECKSGLSAGYWLSASVAQVTAPPLARRKIRRREPRRVPAGSRGGVRWVRAALTWLGAPPRGKRRP
jgi:hypothetical protein